MSTNPEPSLTENTHRVVNNATPTIVPCRICGAIGEVTERAGSPKFAVQCPNRRRLRGMHGAKDDGCANTETHYRSDAKRAVYYWNTLQMGVQKHSYNEQMDRKASAPHCLRCGLRGAHECLFGEGFQRLADYGTASARVRMGG